RMAAAEGLQPRPLPLPVPVVPAEPEVDPAEAAEAALNLSRNARRAIQRDLTTLGYDTRGIDGIFGPGTRGAIGAWQPPAGYAPTGFLNTQQIRRLAQMAEARRAEIARAEEAARQAAEAERLARERADNDWWARTGALGTEAGYDAYLGRYPNGLHADEARRELAFLRARPGGGFVTPEDRALWRQARELDRIEGYEEYLYRQPRGAFRDEASARIEELRRERRRERNAVWQEQESRLGLGTIQWLAIETRLASAGYPVGRVDGRIDRDTRRALREFQRRNGIEVTGYITSSGQIPLILSGR
ncbi:MAG: peptidoglycan-binding domain-containing protein, partial [Pseudomonadota bacterium]